MTENLLQKLEERMMVLLTEVEELRGKLQQAQQENAGLVAEKENHAKKVQDLIALLDSVTPVEAVAAVSSISPIKPVYVQEKVF